MTQLPRNNKQSMSQYLLIRWNASTSNYSSCLEQTYQQIPIDLNRTLLKEVQLSVGGVKKVLGIDKSTFVGQVWLTLTNPQSDELRNYCLFLCSKIRFRNQFTDSDQNKNVEDQVFSCYVTADSVSEGHETLAKKTKKPSTTVPRAKLSSRLMVILGRLQPPVWNKRNAE